LPTNERQIQNHTRIINLLVYFSNHKFVWSGRNNLTNLGFGTRAAALPANLSAGFGAAAIFP